MASRLPHHSTGVSTWLGAALGCLSIAADIFKWPKPAGYVFLALAVLFFVVAGIAYAQERRAKRMSPAVHDLPPNSLGANRLVNGPTGRVIGMNVITDETENEGLIAKDYPPPPPPVLDLSRSHDINFGGIDFNAKGTVLKTEDSYNISIQNSRITQRDEEDGETPITS
ncbi:MAG: hypothetical protein WCF25_12835 [Acidimicrobiales bacterium]